MRDDPRLTGNGAAASTRTGGRPRPLVLDGDAAAFQAIEFFASGRTLPPAPGRVRLIVAGWVRLVDQLADGRTIDVALLGPGEYLSGAGEAERPLAVAWTDAITQAFALGADANGTGAALDGAGWQALASSLARQLDAAHALIDDVLSRDVATRLARTLLRLATLDERGAPADGRQVYLAITAQQLTEMVGAHYITVTRRLQELARDGALVANGRGYLLDPERLRALDGATMDAGER